MDKEEKEEAADYGKNVGKIQRFEVGFWLV